MIVRSETDSELHIDIPKPKLRELGYFVFPPHDNDIDENGEMKVSNAILLDIYEYCKTAKKDN